MSEQWPDLVESVRARLHADLDARLNLLAEMPAGGASGRTLEDDIRQLAAAQSASGVLTAMARAATGRVPSATLFVGDAQKVELWSPDGARAVDREQATFAAPLLLDGVEVAALCAYDNALDEKARQSITLLASHGAARLGCITATRTAQAMQWLHRQEATTAADVTTASSSSSDEEEQAARRYARLLVSEIKLYNEAAVKLGREHGDLSRRLAPEIDRARRLYEQRVSQALPSRAAAFDDELVHTLAGGERSLLG